MRSAHTSAGPIGSDSLRSSSTGRLSSGASTSASIRSALRMSSVTYIQAVPMAFGTGSARPSLTSAAVRRARPSPNSSGVVL